MSCFGGSTSCLVGSASCLGGSTSCCGSSTSCLGGSTSCLGDSTASADGETYSQLKIATAQADALKIQNAALAQNKDVLELRRIEVEMVRAKQWNGDVPTSAHLEIPANWDDAVPFANFRGNPTIR